MAKAEKILSIVYGDSKPKYSDTMVNQQLNFTYYFTLRREVIFINKIIRPIYFEEWRFVDIEGVVKNYYLVSTTGKVKNIKGQILKPQLINSGYLVYRLYNGNKYPPKYKHVLAHRLVMMTFHPVNNQNELTVNHKNTDKLDNYDENLEWMTYAENTMHGVLAHHQYGVNIYNSLFNIEQLKIIYHELQKGTKYSDILKLINIEDNENNRDYIGNIKRGKTYQRELQEIISEESSTTRGNS